METGKNDLENENWAQELENGIEKTRHWDNVDWNSELETGSWDRELGKIDLQKELETGNWEMELEKREWDSLETGPGTGNWKRDPENKGPGTWKLEKKGFGKRELDTGIGTRD